MDYLSFAKGLLGEIKAFKSYKKLNIACRILMAIAVSPFIALAGLYAIAYCVLIFLKNASTMPADELEAWLDKRKNGEQSGPTAIIYLISLPMIYLFRIIGAVISVSFYFVWFFMVSCTYVATLGGVRWQPFLINVTYKEEYTWGYKFEKAMGGQALDIFSIIISATALTFFTVAAVLLIILETVFLYFIPMVMEAVAIAIVFAKKNVRVNAGDEEEAPAIAEAPAEDPAV